MKTIRLTYKNEELDLTEVEAISLHTALTKAMTKAGISPENFGASLPGPGVKTFTTDGKAIVKTDC